MLGKKGGLAVRSYLLAFALVCVCSCGGGGSSGGASQNPAGGSSGSSANATASGADDNEALVTTKVIDGYIQGANVYIDFNWNLQQDEGEPSAVDNGNGDYEFPYKNGEFDAINEISFACAQQRIQVAEVPVGAVDADLGTVTEAFTMYFVPSSFANSGLVNISPFTGLFLDVVREVKDRLGLDGISVTDGCGADAEAIASAVIQSIDDFVEELRDRYQVTLADLYDDYIASNDVERRAKAEKIVGFLQAASGVREALRVQFSDDLPEGYEPFVGLSQASSEQLFGTATEDLEVVEVSVGINFSGDDDADGWAVTNNLHTQGLKVLGNGKILAYDCSSLTAIESCESYEPTYSNILDQLTAYLSYGGHVNDSLIPNVNVTSQYREEKTRGESATQCSFRADLIFDEVRECAGAGCPDLVEVQEQIMHNIGFAYPADCANRTEPYLHAHNDRKNIWNNRVNDRGNSEELFAVQYRLGESSALYSNPPREFLGSDRSQIDYPATYQKLKDLFVDTETFQAAQAALKEDEFVAISYTTFGESRVRNERVVYLVRSGDDTTNDCTIYTGAESGWVRASTSVGEAAKELCFEKIQAFTFY